MPPNQMLLGRGNLTADVMFIGIAPNKGYKSNRMTLSPYSVTGKRFNRLLESIGNNLPQKQGYSYWVTNYVKCDCEKRDWKSTMDNCRSILEEEIDIVSPSLIVLFGNVLVKQILNEFSVKPGKLTREGKYLYMHSYHPSARGGAFEDSRQIVVDEISKLLRSQMRADFIDKQNKKAAN